MVDFPSAVNPPGGVSYAAPLIGLALGKQLSELPGQYQQGFVDARKRAMMDAFPNGMPTKPDGSPDVNAVINTSAKLGGVESMSPLLNMLLSQQIGEQESGRLDDIDRQANGLPPRGPANVGQQSPQTSQSQPQQRPQLSSMGTDNTGADTPRSIATEAFGGRDVSALIPRFSAAIGVQPDQPLSQAQVTQLRTMMARTAQTMSPQQPGAVPVKTQTFPAAGSPEGGAAPPRGAIDSPHAAGPGNLRVPPQQPRPQQPQQQTPAPSVTQGPPQSGPARMPPGITMEMLRQKERAAANAAALAASISYSKGPEQAKIALQRSQNYADEVKQMREQIAKYNEPTNTERDAGRSGMTPLEYGGREALEKKFGEGEAAAIGEYVTAGRAAQKRTEMLNIMGDALKAGAGKMTTGPFAETALKAKQALSSAFGIDFEGLQPAEVISKMGFSLATQTVKEISNRPTQLEVRQALANNPGLLLSEKGSEFMINILKQTARQDADLSKLLQKPENRRDWTGTVDHYYQSHPIVSPFTGKPVGAEDIKRLEGAAGSVSQQQPGHPAAQAAKSIPSNLTTIDQIKTWAASQGLKPGDPIRTPTGAIKAVP